MCLTPALSAASIATRWCFSRPCQAGDDRSEIKFERVGEDRVDGVFVAPEAVRLLAPVPLWVNTGEAEGLFFDDCEWAKEMREAGNDVTLDVEKKVPHDVMMIANLLGFHAEAKACAKRVGEWLGTKTK